MYRLYFEKNIKKLTVVCDRALGVSKKTGEPEPENRETGVPVLIPLWKNQKPGTPISVPGFWYPVFTGLPGTGLYIFFIFFLVRTLHFSFLVCLHTCFYFLLF
jgi:hypothetical protein